MTDFLAATRVFYDTIAEDYAARFHGQLAAAPLDRAVLTAFAELVAAGAARGAGRGLADLGCGPGRVTGFLAGLGAEAFGVDLSASMLAVARREHPELRFEQGSMLELDLPDGGLAGVLSWYSSIHTPAERLPDLFAEFHRVLAPGGHLLIGFQVGDEPRRYEEAFGHSVTLDFQRRRPEQMARLLENAGFALRSHTVRSPDEPAGEQVPQAHLIARKPEDPASAGAGASAEASAETSA
ncbi:methyltransferase domain-containing protein [Streptomyces sp. NPDC046985]|uniref:class I SAM-dependent methyltransferase n=1 Tax=Streptomyces sp. NPDC046985 TaxID=3155377 RepID=UPI0033CABC33